MPFENTNPLFRPFLGQPTAAPVLGTPLTMPTTAPVLPAVAPTPISRAMTPADNARAAYTAEAAKPAGVDAIHNPLLRGIARAGDITASVFAHRLAQFIPGTTLNHEFNVGRAAKRATEAGAQEKTMADVEETQAKEGLDRAQEAYNLARPTIEAGKVDQKRKTAQNAIVQKLINSGHTPQFDEEGNLVDAPDDTESAAYQSRKVADEAHNAQRELSEARTAVEQAKNDPNSPAFKLANDRLNIARQNAGAAALRAQAYYGNYLQGAFNTDAHGNVLPGAPIISNEEGGQQVVGTKNASQAVKAQANVAQFKDVHGALDHLETAADDLVKSGGRLNSPAVAAALATPHKTATQWLQSLDKANLTPQERNYVQSVISAHENVQALRKSAGGTATDTSVARLEAMMPNASTPDVSYLKGQLKQVRETANRLGVGVTTVKGGLSNPKEAPKESTDSGVEEYVRDAKGKLVKKGAK